MVTFNNSLTYNLNKSKRFLGVEIEIAYSDPNKRYLLEQTASKWYGDVGYDGSVGGVHPPEKLREHFKPTSLEIRTAPTNGDLFIKQILEYTNALHNSNSAANMSCGLHIHTDARDLKDADLDKVLMLWSKIEKSMFSLVHPKRPKADWCNPWNFESNMVKITKKIAYESGENDDGWCDTCDDYCSKNHRNKVNGRILAKVKDGSYDLERYKSLNLCSLSEHGTLENRMYHGSTNPDSIINWALINATIVDYAKKNSLTSISKLEKSFDTLLAIIPTDNIRRWAIDKKEGWVKRPITTLKQDQIDDRKWRDRGY